jgi:hypothetical protein
MPAIISTPGSAIGWTTNPADLAGGPAHPVRVVEVEVDGADVGLVHDVGVGGLEGDREPQLGGPGGGAVGVGGEHGGHHGDAEGTEQLARLDR